eukprot:2502587-Rhodomonas_salina.7
MHVDEVSSAICLRACYAMSGTDIADAAPLSAYALAMRCPRVGCYQCDVTFNFGLCNPDSFKGSGTVLPESA